MADARDGVIDALGLSLRYYQWGSSGEPLVLVHGFLDQAYSWKLFAGALLDASDKPLRIVAADCRGHGDSGWVGAGGYYHFPDYVFDLDCLVQGLGFDRFNLIGHSMGGTVSYLYAGAFPARVAKLVLIEGIGPPGMNFTDAPARMEKWISEVRERDRSHFREYTSVEAGAHQLRQTNPRLEKRLALELAQAAMRQNEHGRWVWKFDPLHRTTAPQPFYAGQALEFLRRIRCPVLIVEGQQSRQAKHADQQLRYDAIANRRSVVIDGAGHMVHHDRPRHLADVVLSFLNEGEV